VYHLELRKFPHAVCRFNQSEAQVRAILVAWVNEQWFEEGEQKWNSNEATLIVLEGPKLSMPELAMGRGWRNAQRRSEDVTERVLAAVRQQVQPAGAAASTVSGATQAAATRSASAAEVELLGDSLALELLALLDEEPVVLGRVWSLAAERLSDASAAQSLALAEHAVRSLVGRGLAVLREPDKPGVDGDGPEAAKAWQAVTDDRVEAVLREGENWGGSERRTLQIARKT
jgi:hypothetical protein